MCRSNLRIRSTKANSTNILNMCTSLWRSQLHSKWCNNHRHNPDN
jgi:hypothetical protein